MKIIKLGFTLIELLVVIAIIAILAAILFPIFSQARLSAVNIQDMSNIRQIGVSLIMYSQDYDETYVPVGSWNDPTITPFTNPEGSSPGVPWNGWALKLMTYAKNRNIFHSPFMPNKATWWTGACSSSNGMPITSTYSYNWFLGADNSYVDHSEGVFYNYTPNGVKFESPLGLAGVDSPSSTVAFMMSQTTSPYGTDFGCDYNMIESPDWDNKVRFRAIFKDGSNLAFADGHVKFLIAKEADSAGSRYPKCQGAPSHTIYIWKSKNIWAYPHYPSDDGGFPTEPTPEECAR